MNCSAKILSLLIFFFLSGYTLRTSSQDLMVHTDSFRSTIAGAPSLESKARILADSGRIQSAANLKEHQLVLAQSKNFVLIKNEIEKTRSFLQQGFQYRLIRDEISRLIQWKALAIEGVIVDEDRIFSVRNLTTTSILLTEILNRTNNRLAQILTYHKSLGTFQHILDSLASDSILYIVPTDSVSVANYYQNLNFVIRDIRPVNLDLKAALDSIQRVEIQVNLLKFGLESDISTVESMRAKIFAQFDTSEMAWMGSSMGDEKSISEVLSFSLGKAKLVLLFYVVNHLENLILIVLFIVGVYLFLVMLKRKADNEDIYSHLRHHDHVLRHPFASSVLLVLTISQFFIPLPPVIFSGITWIISAIVLSLIIRNSMSRFWFNAWLFYFVMFLLAFLGNLIVRHSSFERLSLLIMSVIGVGTGSFFLLTKKTREIKEKLILLAIGVMVFFQLLAIYFNLTGGFNLAKALIINGVYSIIVAFLLLWSARLLNDVLRISYHFYKRNEGKSHAVFNEVSVEKIPRYYYLLFILGWFILTARNYYYFQTMFEPLRESLTKTRTIGEFSFTYQSIFIFFFVLILSGIIAQVVSFLASDNVTTPNKSRKNGLGSWVLLIRITIFTAGVLLAFVSAGIPMDRFAIILGAMSVGIGFGLQALVNNLISGLVIAFEKPVNVGDIVDIAGQNGKMKSIGIRSSVISTWDGADVIIPNGDLLNQHLVNWTLGNSTRRFEILIGVAYGTDLAKTKQLLIDLMQSDSRILKHPEPEVLAKEFSASSVDLRVIFWVARFNIGFDVKSDLIIAIDACFREHGIVIPFPQQDVHLHTDVTCMELPE